MQSRLVMILRLSFQAAFYFLIGLAAITMTITDQVPVVQFSKNFNVSTAVELLLKTGINYHNPYFNISLFEVPHQQF